MEPDVFTCTGVPKPIVEEQALDPCRLEARPAHLLRLRIPSCLQHSAPLGHVLLDPIQRRELSGCPHRREGGRGILQSSPTGLGDGTGKVERSVVFEQWVGMVVDGWMVKDDLAKVIRHWCNLCGEGEN
jgi:hypothetical protein